MLMTPIFGFVVSMISYGRTLSPFNIPPGWFPASDREIGRG